MVCKRRGKRGVIFGAGVCRKLLWKARQPLDTYDPSFAASADFSRTLFAAALSIFRTLLHSLSKPAMAFIDLNSIHHFQPPRSAGRPLKERSEGRSTAWKRGASKISSDHDDSAASVPKTKTSAETSEPAGCVDLTTPPPMETGGDPFSEPALSFGGTKNVQGKPISL